MSDNGFARPGSIPPFFPQPSSPPAPGVSVGPQLPQQTAHRADEATTTPSYRSSEPPALSPVRSPGGTDTPTAPPPDRGTHVGNAGVVASHIEQLILETRKRDVLEGVVLERHDITDGPFIREAQWEEAWEEAIDHDSLRLRQHVLIVVAPRSFGSTTFALHLLARHTDSDTRLVKLDADWSSPTVGRLPLEERHAFQLDLKDPDCDQPSPDFLNSLSKHATNLKACGSHLVITVAKELWTDDHFLRHRAGIQTVYLKEPPTSLKVVEGHLRFHHHVHLIPYIQSSIEAKAALLGLDAVEAVRAAGKAVQAWEEHTRQQTTSPLLTPDRASYEATASFEERLAGALSDWRDKLDLLFGEVSATHNQHDASLTIEDRCLLMALAVRQSAPMASVATCARDLQGRVTEDQVGMTTASVFAGRGLRRRIHEIGASVDSHDTVIFEQPSYGRAVLAYVWDNYEVMRDPVLAWLVQNGTDQEASARVADVITELVLRHGRVTYLNVLGTMLSREDKGLLSLVMERAVQDEHVGRQAWEVLYRWAGQPDRALTVISTCQSILRSSSSSRSSTKRAMVRLRRITHTIDDRATRERVLEAYRDLAQLPGGAERLVAEVNAWQSSKASRKSGSLAFLALMPQEYNGMPWLLSDTPPDIEVDRALQDLLGEDATAEEVIPAITNWIRNCATDPSTYSRLRDRLVPTLRGHKMFQACMELMRALGDIPSIGDINVAEDFYQHLVDPAVRPVFTPQGRSL
ncbi:hypothetical protein ACWGIB_04975 [Streptomyces xiamenensis]